MQPAEERVKVGSRIIAVNGAEVGNKAQIDDAIAQAPYAQPLPCLLAERCRADCGRSGRPGEKSVSFSFRRGQQGILSALSVDPRELELTMHGMPKIDLEDWRRNTVYKGRCVPEHRNSLASRRMVCRHCVALQVRGGLASGDVVLVDARRLG